MHRMIYTTKDIYSPYMKLASVHIDEYDSDTIYIRFTMNTYFDEAFPAIDSLYEKLVDVFLYDPSSPYQQCDLIIYFEGNTYKYFKIYVSDEGKSVHLSMTVSKISLAEIVERFPETTELYSDGSLQYENIEDLQGFDNLKVLGLGIKMPKEDKEYIHSIYPDCYIDPRYVQDGTMYYDTEE